MEQVIMGIFVLVVVLVVKRKTAFKVHWQPDRGTWVAAGTGLLAFLLSAVLLILEPDSLPSNLVLYGGIWLGCGVVVPWGYVLLVEKGTPAGLGLRREKWVQSLGISVGLALFFSLVIFFQADLSALDLAEIGRAAVVLIGAGGLFELFLYYGFIHLRLERAFGTLPAILLTALIYVLWHTGTQFPLEANPWSGAFKLLGVGVMFQAVFSLTYNLLIIWPFFMGMGVMIDFMVNIGDLERITAAYPWALVTLVLMGLVAFGIWFYAQHERRAIQPRFEAGKTPGPG